MKHITIVIALLASGCAYAGWDMAEPAYSTTQVDGNLVARSYAVGKTTYVADANGNYRGQVQPSSVTGSSSVFDSDQQYVGQVNRSSHQIAPIPAIPTIPAIPR